MKPRIRVPWVLREVPPCDDCSSFDFSCTGKCMTLDSVIQKSRKIVGAMTQEEWVEMLRKQSESLSRSEAQWAKDFFGRCKNTFVSEPELK